MASLEPTEETAGEFLMLPMFSYYPSIPLPVRAPLGESTEHDCPYLPGRLAKTRGLGARTITPDAYRACMDANFRRSGHAIYQPICRGCRQCIQIRVPVATFAPTKSQRRAARRNADLSVAIDVPTLTDERVDLYRRYVAGWHGRIDLPDADELRTFLYDSPVETLEFCHRDAGGRLLAVGICDLAEDALSSVYFFFDPAESARSLGTAGVLREIRYAAERRLEHYYLGYWVAGSNNMRYKADFGPSELLGTDGQWRPFEVTMRQMDLARSDSPS